MQMIKGQSGYWFFQFRLDHARLFGGDCNPAAVLSYLLNLLRMKNSNPKDQEFLKENNLWFQCPAKQIQEHFGMTDHRQSRIIRDLKEVGILATDHRKGNLLWIKVDIEKLLDLTQKPGNRETRKPGDRTPESGDPNPRKPGIPIYTNNLSNNLTETVPGGTVEKNGFFEDSKKPRKHKLAEKLASLLADCLSRRSQLFRRPNLSSWAKEFELLLTGLTQGDPHRLKESYLEVKNLIPVHADNIHDEFWPKLRSAKSFCENFPRVRDAVSRKTKQARRREVEEEVIN